MDPNQRAQLACKCRVGCTLYYLAILRLMGWERSILLCSALIPIFIYGYGLMTGSMDLNELFLTAPLLPFPMPSVRELHFKVSITTNQLMNKSKYLRPEITQPPGYKDREQVYRADHHPSSNAEGKFLSYQCQGWRTGPGRPIGNLS